MTRGRRPVSAEAKRLAGNPGKRPLSQPLELPAAPDAPPAWFDDEARAEWERVVPELQRLGLFSLLDRAALSGYCSTWSQFVALSAVVERTGPIQVTRTAALRPNPAVAMATKLRDQLRSWCAELGLTPASRGRLAIREPLEAAADPFARFDAPAPSHPKGPTP